MGESLWGIEFNSIPIIKNAPKKAVKAVDDLNIDKKLKSKVVSIDEKLDAIYAEVNRVLGVYKENTIVIKTKQQLIEYIDKAINNNIIAIDTETNNSLDPLTCKLMGPCIYTPGMKNAYIPINHINPYTKQRLNWQLTEDDIKEQFERLNGINILTHNGKFDYEVLYCTTGWKMPFTWDSMVAARILCETERAGLKQQYIDKIDPNIEKYSIDKLFENIEYSYVDPDIFALYAATDAYMTYKLYQYQINILNKKENAGLLRIINDVEIPILFVAADMELRGVSLDTDYCVRLSKKYHEMLDDVNIKIEDELKKYDLKIKQWRSTDVANIKPKSTKPNKNGEYKLQKSKSEQLKDPIEVTSPTQLAILLYDILQAPVTDKKTPRGTGEEFLERLKDQFPICELILEQRSILKLINAFIDALPKMLSVKDNKIHAQLHALGADSGRFSCTSPNLQQIPSKNKQIRLCFIGSEVKNDRQIVDNILELNNVEDVLKDSSWISCKLLKIGDIIYNCRIKDIKNIDNKIRFLLEDIEGDV